MRENAEERERWWVGRERVCVHVRQREGQRERERGVEGEVRFVLSLIHI